MGFVDGGGGRLKDPAHGRELGRAERRFGSIPAYRDHRRRRLPGQRHRHRQQRNDPSKFGPRHEIDGDRGPDGDRGGGVDVQDDLAVPTVGMGGGARCIGRAEDRDGRVEHLDVGQRRIQPGHEQVRIRRMAGGIGQVAATEFEYADGLRGDGRRHRRKPIQLRNLGRRDRGDRHARSAAVKGHAAVVQAEHRRNQIDDVARQVNRPVMSAIGLVRRLVHLELDAERLVDLRDRSRYLDHATWQADFDDRQAARGGEGSHLVGILLRGTMARGGVMARRGSALPAGDPRPVLHVGRRRRIRTRPQDYHDAQDVVRVGGADAPGAGLVESLAAFQADWIGS